MSRYLQSPSGSRIDSRPIACLRITSGCLGATLLTVVLAVLAAAGAKALAGVATAVGFLGLIGGVGWMYVQLFRCGKRLDEAVRHWYEGRTEPAVAGAQAALPIAFRADFRCKGYHVLGLCAEAYGDFAGAEELFRMADQSVPAMAAPKRKQRAKCLILAHHAMALCALGRIPEAQHAIGGARQEFIQSGQTGAANALMDDATWGLGNISANSVLESIEARRHHPGLLALAEARVAYALGDGQSVMRIAHERKQWLDVSLMPREQLLLQTMLQRVQGAPAPAGAPHDQQWVAQALGG